MPRAVVLMFDSLNRHTLIEHADELPNFSRLSDTMLVGDRFYAGSMPCMPARRELHTGRPNFLHRSWGPIEPFDISVPEILDEHGVHTHLISDHGHYWEDGGANYHTRFTTWESFRGQEGDPWKAEVDGPLRTTAQPRIRAQDQVNRGHQQSEADHSQTRCVDAALEFLQTNSCADDWMLHLELFDPHEPFFTYDRYRRGHQGDSAREAGAGSTAQADDGVMDWPHYGRCTEDAPLVQQVQDEYLALLKMCDHSVGRILKAFDEHGLWDDTMLIVNTDHGYLLGEHGWWAKTVMPWYEELVHLPFYFHCPGVSRAGEHSSLLLQTIDIPATLLAYFGLDKPEQMIGRDIAEAVRTRSSPREWALFGVHAGHVNVTDGRRVYMRSCASPENAPIEEYTLMPAHMRRRFSPEALREWQPAEPFPFTQGVRTLCLPVSGEHSWFNPYAHGTLLFDLETDPQQQNPLIDDELELEMIALLLQGMRASDAPKSQYQRLGLPETGDPGAEHLLVRVQRDRAEAMANPLRTGPHSAVLDRPLSELLDAPGTGALIRSLLKDALDTEIVAAPPSMSLWGMARSGIIPPSLVLKLEQALRSPA